MSLPANILCLGAAHFDRTMQCLNPFVPAASNPVKTLHRKPGGVGRNIAVHLRLLGCNVGMAGAVGRDGDGSQIVQSLSEIGIDTRLLDRLPGQHTPGYTAILDMEGDLALGLIDAETYEKLTPDHFESRLSQLKQWDFWVADANLPAETLLWLSRNKGAVPLCAATVSPSKAIRWKDIIGDVDLLIANRIESQILTDQAVGSIEDALDAAKTLQDKGTPRVIITLGAQGIVALNKGDASFWAPLPTRLVDANGAGDAFFAGFTAAFATNHHDFDAAIAQGLAMASLTAETHGTTVWDLDAKIVQERTKQAVKQVL
ncbi:PfkB family carbohydrate kinase [Thalassospira mesophila]|uniref:Carbohydrate kinase PfkB domain-containing protein n=1 Tax=Thalassospira mesophila TaxID=1293891 RepID=A0A1Y2KVM0_9PROT|nr:PfkB family carbohydrate kinase [Thalassospira mesophila]OSQ35655.1 hypothetical protein TMES_20650 [Thalassospira mesophila]